MSSPIEVPFVRVVLLNFNGGASIIGAVGAAVATDWPQDRRQIVCVDNGSTDGSIERVEREYPDVLIVRNGVNLGFPGNNSAMRNLDEVDYVALINSDAFVEVGWLRPLVETAESDRTIGAVCPKILFNGEFVEVPLAVRTPKGTTPYAVRLRSLRVNGREEFPRCHVALGGGRSSDRAGLFEWICDGSVLRFPLHREDRGKESLALEIGFQVDETCDVAVGGTSVRLGPAGTRQVVTALLDGTPPTVPVLNNVGSWLDPSWIGHERGLYRVDDGDFDRVMEVGTWCGAAVLLASSMLEDVGLFDDAFFLYYEDTDLAVRGRERGWKFVAEPSSRVFHDHSASTVEGSALTAFHVERNRLMLVVRHAALGEVFEVTFGFFLVTLSYALKELRDAVRQSRRFDGTVVFRRVRSMLGLIGKLPHALRARRRFSRRRLLSREQLKQTISLGSWSSGGSPP